jgi:cytosine/adenosine deaminase-related metal-dependent hydrolase
LKWWRPAATATQTCRPGVSPHAPYSVSVPLFFRASIASLPLAVHLAETRAELDLLGDRCGPFVPFLKELNVWYPAGLAESINHILELGRNAYPCLFIHCNYLSPDAPIPSRGAVVYCPRTHAAFGHPAHPFRDFLARGVRVALGTDSLASNPDLSLLAEARFVHSRHPDLPGATLLQMATLSGAEVLGWADETGSLEPGKSADFVMVPLPSRDEPDSHTLLFASELPIRETWFRGRRVWPAD